MGRWLGRGLWGFWVRCGGAVRFLLIGVGLTWLGVGVCGVELLEGGAGVGLDEDHCVAAFVAGGYLDSGGFGEDVQGHDHAC